jgi:hypothetical protein
VTERARRTAPGIDDALRSHLRRRVSAGGATECAEARHGQLDDHFDARARARARGEPPAVVGRTRRRPGARRIGGTAEGETRGRGERGSVGRVLGSGPPDERDAEARDGHREPDTDDEQAEDEERDRTALVVVAGMTERHGAAHRSTRMVELACSSGSGKSLPTSGRFVTDR